MQLHRNQKLNSSTSHHKSRYFIPSISVSFLQSCSTVLFVTASSSYTSNIKSSNKRTMRHVRVASKQDLLWHRRECFDKKECTLANSSSTSFASIFFSISGVSSLRSCPTCVWASRSWYCLIETCNIVPLGSWGNWYVSKFIWSSLGLGNTTRLDPFRSNLLDFIYISVQPCLLASLDVIHVSLLRKLLMSCKKVPRWSHLLCRKDVPWNLYTHPTKPLVGERFSAKPNLTKFDSVSTSHIFGQSMAE